MATKRYSVDINGTRETVQTFNVWTGDGAKNNTLHVRMVHGAKVELVDTTTRTAPKSIRAKRVGSDLHVALPDGDINRPDLVIDKYFAKGQPPGQLIGRDAKGQYFNFGTLSSGQMAENAPVTASLGGKAVSPWGSVMDAPVVMSESRAGLGDVDAAPATSSGKSVAPSGSAAAAGAPSTPAPVLAKPAAEAAGAGWGSTGWIAAGLGAAGLAVAGGGGGGGSASNTSTTPSTPTTPGAPTVATVTSAKSTVTEGEAIAFNVALSAPTDAPTSYAFAFKGTGAGASDIGALTGSNGVTVSGSTVVVPKGVQTFTLSVPTIANSTAESTESVALDLGGKVSADVAVSDPPGRPGVSAVTASSASVTEGATVTFAVSLASATTKAETYAFKLSGSASGSADLNPPTFTQGVTFDTASGNITVPAGVTSFNASVGTKDDALFESAEKLSATVGGLSSAEVTVNENDTAPAVDLVNGTTTSVEEGRSAVFTVTLSGAADTAQSFAMSMGGTLPSDQRGTPVLSDGAAFAAGQVSVPAGVTSFTVTIPTVDNTTFSVNRSLVLTVGGENDSISIQNNDPIFGGASLASPASLSVDVVTLSDTGGIQQVSGFLSGPSGDLIDVTALLGAAQVVQAASPDLQALQGNHVVLMPVESALTADSLARAVAAFTVDAGSKQVFALENSAEPQSSQVFLAQDTNGDHRLDASEIHQIAQIAFSAGSTSADLDASNFIVQPVIGG